MIVILIYIAVAVISYLLGSLNFGIIISNKFKNDDVRQHGSGNAGTTNMLRNYGKLWGALTIIGDMAKVGVAILISVYILKATNVYDLLEEFFDDNTLIVVKSFSGLFCVIGHIFPCFFGFKGGKGVATAGGMVFAVDWRIALILLAVFVVIVLITKYVSLGSIVMALLYPILIFIFYHSALITIISAVFTLIIIISHRGNIKKLITHTENKISFKKQ